MFGLFDKASEKAIEGIFISTLEEFDVGDLDLAVNEKISLLEETLKYRPHILRMAERLAKQFNGQKEYLTNENLMIWIKQKRSDLYFSILLDNTGKKRKWLETQLEEFRKYLFN